jgi:hypothetical protein
VNLIVMAALAALLSQGIGAGSLGSAGTNAAVRASKGGSTGPWSVVAAEQTPPPAPTGNDGILGSGPTH